MNQDMGLARIAKGISDIIQEEIERVGVFYRIFSRVKTTSSIEKKLNLKNYDGVNTFLTDIIGIRVVFYFADDLEIINKFLKEKYSYLQPEETRDKKKVAVFEPERVNIVFNIPNEFNSEFSEVVSNVKVKNTFELQLRTIFSEGWHEIEHDLRYKNKQHWDGYEDLSRIMNGILAALETNDWSIISLFNQLAYNHYKSQNIDAMIRTKFRLRFSGDKAISQKLSDILSGNKDCTKELFKLDREVFLFTLACTNIKFPLTIDNFIFYLNYQYFKNKDITSVTPEILLNDFNYLSNIK